MNDRPRKAKRPGPRPKLAPLAREEWDFGKCPTDQLSLCFAYEYARESPWALEKFKRRKEDDHDEWGIWHLHAPVLQGEQETDEEFEKFLDEVGLSEEYDWDLPPTVDLWLPPEFPETPFLRCTFDFGAWQDWCDDYWAEELAPYETDDTWGLRPLPLKDLPDIGETDYAFEIEWDASDGRLLKEFQAWLRKTRPRPPVERRGKSQAREVAADLKALGSYRLLQRFSAPEAQEYTQQHMREGLYAKLPDWYEARKRAERILRAFFKTPPRPADRP